MPSITLGLLLFDNVLAFYSSSMLHSLINQLLAAFANSVRAGLIALNSNAYRLIAFRADQHHIRNINRPFKLNSARIDISSCLGLYLALMLGVNTNTLHHHTVFFHHHIDDFAALAFVFEAPADDFHSIAFTDFHSHSNTPTALPAPATRSS